MKKVFKILSLLLMLLFSTSAFFGCEKPYFVYDEQGLAYHLMGSSYEISLGDCEEKEIVIPSIFKGKPVSTISVFTGSTLKSVKISKGVEIIEAWAFCDSRMLVSVELPDGLCKIGIGAFSDCRSLRNIEIPDGIKNIEKGTFSSCEELESVVLPDSIETISERAFAHCKSLTYIDLPVSIKEIGRSAFVNCSALTSIYYNGTVEEWEKIVKGDDWNRGVPATDVFCIDGNVSLI